VFHVTNTNMGIHWCVNIIMRTSGSSFIQLALGITWTAHTDIGSLAWLPCVLHVVKQVSLALLSIYKKKKGSPVLHPYSKPIQSHWQHVRA